MPDLLGVEIFKTGKWNGKRWGQDVIDNLAKNFAQLNAVLSPPLKLGHNDEQEITDGMPALGYVDNVRAEGTSLVADFVDVPQIVYDAISKKLYDTLSIEMLHGVKYKGKEFSHVLSGVALLGADLPAVNTLQGLSKYIDGENKSKHSVEGLTFSAVANFSFKNEDRKMPISEEEFEMLKKKHAAAEAELAKVNKQVVEVTSERDQFKAKEEQRAENDKKEKFAASKKDVESEMEQMVKAGALTPGLRDKFSARMTNEAEVENIRLTVEDLKQQSNFSANNSDDQAKGGDDKVSEDPSAELLTKINEIRAKSPAMSFSAAQRQVFKANPKLAREYTNATGV